MNTRSSLPLPSSEGSQARIVLSLVGVAGLCAGAILTGWILDLASLKSAGAGGSPMWPLPAIGYIFLAAGLWATIFGRRGAPWLLLVPLVIAGVAVPETVLGISTGLDRLLFPEQLAQSGAQYAGRPAGNSIVTLGLLSIALLLTRREAHFSSEMANLLATAALCFALFSAVLLLLMPADGMANPSIIAPLSCSLIAIVLASAFLIWRHDAGWTLLLTDHRARRPFVGILLPVIIALPVLPSLVQRLGAPQPDAPSAAEFVGMLCNVAIIGFLLWVAVRRIGLQQGALQELTLALDVAAIAITRCDGTITYWSHGCETLYGRSAAEAIGRKKYELLESRTGGVPATVSAAGMAADRELLERRSNGTDLCVLEVTRRLERTDQEVMLVLKMLDISERAQSRQALLTSEAQLRSIIDTMPDAMVVVDDANTIRTFSAAAERMFGAKSAEMIGRKVTTLMPAAEATRHDNWISRYLETGETRIIGKTAQLAGRRADGSVFPIELSVGETWLADQRVFTAVIRDVTERRAAEQRLSELSTELAHVSRQSAMGELAADLAHELNQPLSATANFLAAARILVAEGEKGDPRVAELLRMGTEQTLRSGEIIRRLRDFLVKGDVEMREESVERTVREAASLVFFGAADDIRLDCRLDPLAQTLFGDRIQVQQVLVNLLRNAAQALRSRPSTTREIVLASRLAGDMIEISVCDNGPGLPEAVRDQLYSRFSTTKGPGAMGVGLSISKRIVEAHGGTLVAEDRFGGGVCFRMTLPTLEGVKA